MKLGFIVIGTLVLGAVLATWFSEDPGRLLLVFRGYTIQMSVPVMLLLLALLYIVVRIVIRILKAPRQLGAATARMRARQANKHFTRGLIEMAEGNWSRGERLLTRGVRKTDTPLLNYLSAARAAQKQGAHERRDNWLKMAYEQTPAAANAVRLTQAELQVEHQQYEEALATLRKLEENTPNHVQGLSLLARIYHELEDWEQLRDLIPRLRRHKAMTPEALANLEVGTYVKLLQNASSRRDLAGLRTLWQDIPKAARSARTVSTFNASVNPSVDSASASISATMVRSSGRTTASVRGKLCA